MDEHEMEETEEMDVQDLAESNQTLISALVELLVKKGMITNEEFEAEVAAIEAEDDDEDEDDEEGPEEPAPQPAPQPSPQPQMASQRPPQAPLGQAQPRPAQPPPGNPIDRL